MDPQVVTTIAGAPSMFRTLGVEILRGRGFDDRDGPAAPRVVVLSEFTARQMFGTADVVGREMAVGQTRSPTATIVGVAADTDVGSIFADPRPLAYVPLTQHYQVAHLGKPEDIGRVFIGFQTYLYQQEARSAGTPLNR
jgi:ABC-type antimicrobial peptide transport system permease subunit